MINFRRKKVLDQGEEWDVMPSANVDPAEEEAKTFDSAVADMCLQEGEDGEEGGEEAIGMEAEPSANPEHEVATFCFR